MLYEYLAAINWYFDLKGNRKSQYDIFERLPSSQREDVLLEYRKWNCHTK